MPRPITLATVLCALLLAGYATAHAGPVAFPDHLKCYKIKDDGFKTLKATVDLNSPTTGSELGCTVKKPVLYCTAAAKDFRGGTVGKGDDKHPIEPQVISAEPAGGDRICYKLKCPEPFPADRSANDQFGMHTLTKLKPQLLCMPTAPAPCGDSAPLCNGPCPAGGICDNDDMNGGCACFGGGPA